MVKIKICGITSTGDAVMCRDGGADFLGFIFYPKSPRFIDPARAGEIIRTLREEPRGKSVRAVGVFVNADYDYVRRSIAGSSVDMVQFHGDETPEFIGRFSIPRIRAVRVSGPADIAALDGCGGADYVLFDTGVAGLYGGTGRTFDWDLLRGFDRRRMFLSGGISAENVAGAVKRVRPFAVDLSSSLERAPGVKDAEKVEEFFSVFKSITP